MFWKRTFVGPRPLTPNSSMISTKYLGARNLLPERNAHQIVGRSGRSVFSSPICGVRLTVAHPSYLFSGGSAKHPLTPAIVHIGVHRSDCLDSVFRIEGVSVNGIVR